MTKLIIDAGVLDALAGISLTDGATGLNLLLRSGNNFVITQAVRDEFFRASRINSPEIQNWFTQNASRIEGLDVTEP